MTCCCEVEIFMETIMTLEEALERIAELENENAKLKEEVEYYKNRKASGRQKHNAKWRAIYNDFVVCYEGGMTMVEIAKRNNISERSIYRYKAYYDKLREAADNDSGN
ncbi:MAG: helix-turn-helix domain-containing protein [Alphaproteobacteria bacterium]|nr:helix-turn-helix domain-containing protein [Alphaproteobacteria bacterium]